MSRVVNGRPGAAPAVREQVERAVRTLGYRPDLAARALASGRHGAVDVVAVVPGPVHGRLGVHPHYSRVLAGVTQVLNDVDVPLRFHVVDTQDAAEQLEDVARRCTTGVLLADADAALAARVHRRCRRVVSLVATAPQVPAAQVDNVRGARAAVEHLHGLGHRRIGAVHGPVGNVCAADRRRGYHEAVHDLGLPVLHAPGGFRREGGHDAAEELLRQAPDLDAVFVACDLMAAGAVQAFTAAGRSVPRDVSVVGFDDSLAATCTNPPLTTMRLPVERMAATAARLLLDGGCEPGHRELFEVELVERASTCAAGV